MGLISIATIIVNATWCGKPVPRADNRIFCVVCLYVIDFVSGFMIEASSIPSFIGFLLKESVPDFENVSSCRVDKIFLFLWYFVLSKFAKTIFTFLSKQQYSWLVGWLVGWLFFFFQHLNLFGSFSTKLSHFDKKFQTIQFSISIVLFTHS